MSDKLVNPDQYNGEIEFWEGIGPDEIVRRRADIVSWMTNIVDRGDFVVAEGNNVGEGKGIVLTGGNQVCR